MQGLIREGTVSLTEHTHCPSAAKSPGDTEILMCNRNETSSFLLICCKQMANELCNPLLNLVKVLNLT